MGGEIDKWKCEHGFMSYDPQLSPTVPCTKCPPLRAGSALVTYNGNRESEMEWGTRGTRLRRLLVVKDEKEKKKKGRK